MEGERTDVLGYVFTALALLVIGLAIYLAGLWSDFGNETLAWFCSAVALALMVVCAAGLLTGRTPATLPKAAAAVIYLGTVLGTGIVMLLPAWESWGTKLFHRALAEWLGFAVILLILLVVPRLAKSSKQDSAKS